MLLLLPYPAPMRFFFFAPLHTSFVVVAQLLCCCADLFSEVFRRQEGGRAHCQLNLVFSMPSNTQIVCLANLDAGPRASGVEHCLTAGYHGQTKAECRKYMEENNHLSSRQIFLNNERKLESESVSY